MAHNAMKWTRRLKEPRRAFPTCQHIIGLLRPKQAALMRLSKRIRAIDKRQVRNDQPQWAASTIEHWARRFADAALLESESSLRTSIRLSGLFLSFFHNHCQIFAPKSIINSLRPRRIDKTIYSASKEEITERFSQKFRLSTIAYNIYGIPPPCQMIRFAGRLVKKTLQCSRTYGIEHYKI